MPGEEEQTFLAAREELASALRRDSAQTFALEQLRPLLATSLPPASRYLLLDAARLVSCNAHGEPLNYLNTLATALNILEKYGRNLLSPQRPRYWRSVKFNNPVFRSTVDAVQGGRDVLRLYGYTEERPDGLSFPEDQEEPDEHQVATVTLEVLLLRTELSLLLQNAHPREKALEQLLKDKVEDDVLQHSELDPLLREMAPGPLTPPSAAGPPSGPCFLCGSAPGTLHCPACKQVSCPTCDRLFHGHPSRAHHLRQTLPGATQATHLSPSLPASAPPRLPLTSLLAQGDCSLSSPNPASARLPWHCATCAMLNEPWAVLCVACDRPRGCKVLGPGIESSQGTGGLEPELARGQWACQSCTFENEAAAVLCAMCERPRLAQPPSLVVDSHDAGICLQPLKGDTLHSSAQTQVWYCIHCTFCNSGPGWVCAVCNRTSSPIPAQHVPRLDASSLEKELPKPGPSQHLSAPLPSSCGDPEKQRQDKMREEGLQLVIKIREGEVAGACPEEIFSALQYSGTEVPLQWLHSELPYVLEMVTELAGQQDPELGAFSCQEARKAWLDRHGNLDEAVEECVRARRRKVQELQSLGFGPQEGSLQALFQHGGDVARALTELQRQRLEPFHQRLWDTGPEPSWDGPDKQSLVRRLLAVYALPSWGRAELALSLLQETPRNYELLDVVEAVRHSQDRAFLRRLLAQECAVCSWTLPRNRMQALISCECTICPDCFRQHFTIALKEKHITDMVCPACGRPDLTDDTQLLSYFSTLDIQLRESLEPDAYALFHKKLTEAVLMRDPKFLWCAQCSFGFIYEREQLEATCPQCHQTFCVRCKRQWEEQHRGQSCEEFQNWKRNNDPEYQAQGLAMYLQENGIDCPKCKFSYALARGGCMHFHCTQCRHQFCSGCYNTFYAKNKCPEPNCRVKKSLHAHHPRDCLFYLRDWTAARLQKLLQDNNIMFNTEPPAGARAAPGGGCRVMEQKEVPNGLRDEACGKETPPGYAGLCQAHYKEYLVSLINAHSLDPAALYEVEELETATERYLHVHPQPLAGEDAPAYQARLSQKLMEEVPLGQSIPRRRK
ncbi:PREDICTED: E3 ubiquitin-protein ligase RNF31 isoform X2 [Chinchilla lanigera]|uniref:E3 ubiquitin-protein ligase RNF31 isoform X2 n=1 Tax=Chinchilla lanigera TaxID=34839 RepID=UPI00038EF7F8|nr:PREDICTED: E3 ubiquitin-protein ligase RNF31 isoform X2 [Chinchilla lanigera]